MEEDLTNIERESTDGITSYFGKDHDRLDRLFKEFQRLKYTDFQRAKEYFIAFKCGLQRHIIWEEEILFPLFEYKTGMANAGPTFVMRLEHKQIRQMLEDIYTKVKDFNTQTNREEERLMSIMFLHNTKEENVLYPAIDECTCAEEKDKIFMIMNSPPEEGYQKCCSAG